MPSNAKSLVTRTSLCQHLFISFNSRKMRKNQFLMGFRLRILIFTPRIIGLGGIERFSYNLREFLTKNGHDVSVISGDNSFYIPVKGVANLSLAFSASLKCFKKRFDIIHALNLPYILPAQFAKGKRVVTMHGFYLESFMLQHSRILSRIVNLLLPRVLRWADAVTVVSMHSKDILEKYYQIKTHYIPNAIDVGDLPRGTKRISDFQILFAGRLFKVKGLDILIKAMSSVNRKYPNATLVVAGEGKEKDKLTKLAQKLDVNAKFLGYVKWENCIRLIRGSDMVVVPSRKEGLPTIVLESMALGKPVIAAKVGGIPELISNGKNGILVPPKDHVQLTDELIGVISDGEFRKRLGENAKKLISKKYNWDSVYQLYEQLYRSLLS